MKWFNATIMILIIAFYSANYCISAPNHTQDLKEYSFLKSLYMEEGSNNSDLLLRLSQLSINPAEALCYARLGLETNPTSNELKDRINSLRNNSKIKEEIPSGIKSTVSSPSFLILMNFISKKQLSLIFFILSGFTLLLYMLKLIIGCSQKFKTLQIFLYLCSFLFFIQLFLITKTKDGRFRLVSSISDFNKKEGVVISERIVYSAPLEDSQQINILKPSWEINLYDKKDTLPWVLVETSDKRQGWINGTDGICKIND